MTFLLPLLLAGQSAGAMPPETAFGPETVITYAGNGNLREWTRGERGSDTLYVRDRTQRWYQVRLTGPCRLDRPLDTLSYTTDPNGTFDRFSRLRVARYPDQLCGVKSIHRATPPAAFPNVRFANSGR